MTVWHLLALPAGHGAGGSGYGATMSDFEKCPVCGSGLETEPVRSGSDPGEANDRSSRQVCPNGCHESLAWIDAREARDAGME